MSDRVHSKKERDPQPLSLKIEEGERGVRDEFRYLSEEEAC